MNLFTLTAVFILVANKWRVDGQTFFSSGSSFGPIGQSGAVYSESCCSNGEINSGSGFYQSQVSSGGLPFPITGGRTVFTSGGNEVPFFSGPQHGSYPQSSGTFFTNGGDSGFRHSISGPEITHFKNGNGMYEVQRSSGPGFSHTRITGGNAGGGTRFQQFEESSNWESGRPYSFPSVHNNWKDESTLENGPIKIPFSPKLIDDEGFTSNWPENGRRNTRGPIASSFASCGKRIQHQGVVTRGTATQEGDWPWHAAIFHVDSTASTYKCGGTLISSKAVLTAAHCVYENSKALVPDRVVVKLGLHNRLVASSNTQEFKVFKVIVHERFSMSDFSNDIAILKLSTEVNFTPFVQAICLWDQSSTSLDSVIGDIGYVPGWGLDEKATLSELLRQAAMPIVSLTTCLRSNRDFYGTYLSDYNYCAGFRNGTSVCNGDSGGGMYFNKNGVYQLRGLVSLSFADPGKNLCNSYHYIIFTDCAKYLDWITDNTSN